MKHHLKSVAAATAVAILGLSAPALRAQDVVLKFGHAASSTSTYHTGLQLFADKVAEKSDGKVKIELYGDRQLGEDAQLLQSIQLGTVDGALISAPILPLVIGASAFDALQLPFLVTEYEDMSTLLSGEIGQKFLDSLSAQGIKGLGYVEAGQRHFLSKDKAVSATAEFAGLKTRIIPTPLFKEAWAATGANPVGLAYGEVYSALETGTIDAVEINFVSIKAESLYEAANNVTLTGHYFFPGIIMMGANFDGLSEDVQAVLTEAGHEVIAELYTAAAEEEAQVRADLEADGVTVTKLEDLDVMRGKMQPVLNAWSEKDPLIVEFIEAAKALQ